MLQGIATFVLGVILCLNQPGGLFDMLKRIPPPLQRRFAKPPHNIGFLAQHRFGSKKNVTVKIEIVIPWRKDAIRHSCFFQWVRFIGKIGQHGVGFTFDQAFNAERVGDCLDVIHIDSLRLKHRGNGNYTGLIPRQHDPLALQIGNGFEIFPFPGQQNNRRVLQNSSKQNDRLAQRARIHQRRVPDTEIGPLRNHLIDHIDTILDLADLYIKPRLFVKPLLLGHIVTGKLPLMLPDKLQRHPLQRRSQGSSTPP